jgi:GT2 family glycosyltransferase
MDSTREKIAAVVVTYNRKELLGKCLDSLLSQSHPLDALYIVDNGSTDGTYGFLRDRALVPPIAGQERKPGETVASVDAAVSSGRCVKVCYMGLAENTGSAGGFHAGLERAAADGHDWLWLMDDDTLPAPDALAVLVQKKTELQAARSERFILNSLVLAQDGDSDDDLAFPLQELSAAGLPKPRVYHWRLSEVKGRIRNGLYRWVCPFNGMFVPVRVVTEVGLPNPDFFIWGDESDFLWRIAKQFEFYTAVDSKVRHPRCRPGAFTWKSYYQIRNMLVVNRHFSFPVLRNFRLILSSLIAGLRHGRPGLVLVLRAIFDGLTGRLGKREDIHL